MNQCACVSTSPRKPGEHTRPDEKKIAERIFREKRQRCLNTLDRFCKYRLIEKRTKKARNKKRSDDLSEILEKY